MSFLVLFLSFSMAQAELSCVDLLEGYHFKPHMGVKVEMYSTPAYFLGEGEFAAVYRTAIPDHPVVSFKEYKRPDEGFAKIDVGNLELLSVLDSAELRVRTVKVLKSMTPQRVFLESVVGRSLEDLFKAPDSEISPELKRRLYVRYTMYVRSVHEFFKKDPRFSSHLDGVFIAAISFEKVNGSPIFVLKVALHKEQIYKGLKPENFIVDARTLEMILVDPN